MPASSLLELLNGPNTIPSIVLNPPTLGKPNIGASTENEWPYDLAMAWIYTAPASGKSRKIFWYGKTSSGTNTIKVAIYSVSSGLPATRLAISSAVEITTTPGWYEFDIDADLVSGTQYAIALGEGTVDNNLIGYRDVEGVTLHQQSTPTLGASWGGDGSSWDSAHSFYIEIEPEYEDTTPTIEFTGTDIDGDDLRYEIQIDPRITFDSLSVSQGSLSLNNNGAVYKNPSPSNDFTDISFFGWVKITTNNQYNIIFTDGHGGSFGQGFVFGVEDNADGNHLYVDVAYVAFIESALIINDNNWHFVGVQRRASDSKWVFYLDNATDTPGGTSTPFGNGSESRMIVGGENIDESISPQFAGEIARVGFWESLLSSGEIASLLAGAAPGSIATGLVMELLLDGGSWGTNGGSGGTFSENGTLTAGGGITIPGGALLDKVSGTDSGFANTVTGGDTDPFNNGEKVSFTVQAGDALDHGVYFYRAKVKDPNGKDAFVSYTEPKIAYVYAKKVTIDGDGAVTSGWRAEGGDYTRLQNDDGDTNRLYTPTDGDIATFTLQNPSGLSGKTILSVRVFFKVKCVDPVDGTFQIGVRVGGTNYWSADKNTNGDTAYILWDEEWATNPGTGVAWTESDINSLEIGIKKTNTYSGAACAATYAYAVVVYEPITGTATNDARSARITGRDTANSSRSARITGRDTSNDNRGGRISGRDNANATRGARITGTATGNDTRSARVTGKETSNDNRGARVTGIGLVNDTKGARVSGVDTASNNRGGRITGANGANDNRGARLTGTATDNSSRSARVAGKLSDSSNRGGRVSGMDSATATRAGRVAGRAQAVDTRGVRVSGRETANESRSGRIAGNANVSDARGGFVTGTATASNDRVARISGKNTLQESRGGRITGTDGATSTREARVSGRATAEDTRAGRIAGKYTKTDSREARITGSITETDQREARISGQDVGFDTIEARVSGKDTAGDVRGARITGFIFETVSSVRGAVIEGVRRNPYTKKPTTYSDTATPYEKTTPPYSNTGEKYQGRVSPYTGW